MDSLAATTTCQFNDFLLDTRVRMLLRVDSATAPTPIPLGARAFDILCLLIEHRGGLVSKQEIMDAVWPNVAVEENNLTVQISALRRVLDVGRAEESSIQTVIGRGYRFVPRVTADLDAPSLDAIAPPVEAAAIRPLDAPPRDFGMAERPGGFHGQPRPRRPLLLVSAAALIVVCLTVGSLIGWNVWGSRANGPIVAQRL